MFKTKKTLWTFVALVLCALLSLGTMVGLIVNMTKSHSKLYTYTLAYAGAETKIEVDFVSESTMMLYCYQNGKVYDSEDSIYRISSGRLYAGSSLENAQYVGEINSRELVIESPSEVTGYDYDMKIELKANSTITAINVCISFMVIGAVGAIVSGVLLYVFTKKNNSQVVVEVVEEQPAE